MLLADLRWAGFRIAGAVVRRSWKAIQSAGALYPGAPGSDRFGSFGAGSLIGFPSTSLYGEESIHIGEGTLIASWVTLVAGYGPGQETLADRALVIGDRCVIGVGCGIVAHESIELGDDIWLGQNVYITDANHGFSDPDTPIGQQLGDHQPVRIGDGSWIGHGAVILPGVTIGSHAIVAAGAVVTADVADGTIVGGVPSRVLREIPH